MKLGEITVFYVVLFLIFDYLGQKVSLESFQLLLVVFFSARNFFFEQNQDYFLKL